MVCVCGWAGSSGDGGTAKVYEFVDGIWVCGVCMRVCVCVSIFVFMCLYLCACVYVCVCVCVSVTDGTYE